MYTFLSFPGACSRCCGPDSCCRRRNLNSTGVLTTTLYRNIEKLRRLLESGIERLDAPLRASDRCGRWRVPTWSDHDGRPISVVLCVLGRQLIAKGTVLIITAVASLRASRLWGTPCVGNCPAVSSLTRNEGTVRCSWVWLSGRGRMGRPIRRRAVKFIPRLLARPSVDLHPASNHPPTTRTPPVGCHRPPLGDHPTTVRIPIALTPRGNSPHERTTAESHRSLEPRK